VQHTSTPTSSLEILAGTNTYVVRGISEGSQDKCPRIVLYFPDVFGPLYVNDQLLMYYFASHGM
jgi:hypothetical protein